jgi:hypothetical protein
LRDDKVKRLERVQEEMKVNTGHNVTLTTAIRRAIDCGLDAMGEKGKP